MMLANPASVFRLMNQAALGIVDFAVPPFMVMAGILVLWAAALFGCAYGKLKRIAF